MIPGEKVKIEGGLRLQDVRKASESRKPLITVITVVFNATRKVTYLIIIASAKVPMIWKIPKVAT